MDVCLQDEEPVVTVGGKVGKQSIFVTNGQKDKEPLLASVMTVKFQGSNLCE